MSELGSALPADALPRSVTVGFCFSSRRSAAYCGSASTLGMSLVGSADSLALADADRLPPSPVRSGMDARLFDRMSATAFLTSPDTLRMPAVIDGKLGNLVSFGHSGFGSCVPTTATGSAARAARWAPATNPNWLRGLPAAGRGRNVGFPVEMKLMVLAMDRANSAALAPSWPKAARTAPTESLVSRPSRPKPVPPNGRGSVQCRPRSEEH